MKFSPTPPFRLLRRVIVSIDDNGLRAAIAQSWRRLTDSLARNGLGGTLHRAFVKAPTAPAPLAESEAPLPPPHPFDLQHGTDTGGYIPGANLASVSLSSLFSNIYFGIAPSALTQAISALPIDHRDFTFVDIGCGKGRALLVAAEFPFRQLIGVEIAFELCDIAHANIARRPDLAPRISILNQDAATIAYPDTPLVVFLYHPFLAPILRRVLANLQRQLRHAPRETYVLYADNPYKKVVSRFPFLREISDIAYPLSPEDAAAQLTGSTEERFTLYTSTLSR